MNLTEIIKTDNINLNKKPNKIIETIKSHIKRNEFIDIIYSVDDILSFFEKNFLEINITYIEKFVFLIGKIYRNHLYIEKDIDLRLWFYNLLTEKEVEKNRNYKKGHILCEIAQSYLQINNLPFSKRYFILGLIEDIISSTENYKHANYRALKDIFLISNIELDFIVKTTKEELTIENSNTSMLSDHIYLKYLLSPRTKNINSLYSKINKQFANTLFEKLEDSDKKKRGDALEKLTAYLFSSVCGFEIMSKKLNTVDSEIDIVLRNNVKDPIVEEFGKYIIVECKNWKKKTIGTEQINHLIAKVRFQECKVGIIVSLKGISKGKSKGKYSLLTILKAFHQDNIIILNVDSKDLENIISGNDNLLSILVDEYERIKFDRFKRSN